MTLSERKLLDEATSIQEIEWMASFKPQNCNIPAFSDSKSTFEEIQVISVTLGNIDFEKTSKKIIELVQKYIPYHVFLLICNDQYLQLNTTTKRINLNDTIKRSPEITLTSETIELEHPTKEQSQFLENCAFEKLDKQDLRTLYLSWSSCITALKAAEHTGIYQSRAIERTEADVKALEDIKRIEAEILFLQNQAKKESQLSIQLQINSEVQFRRKKLETLKAHLK